MEEEGNLNVDIEIPFPSERIAEIVYHVLRIDREPKREVTKHISYKEKNLLAKFSSSAAHSKNIRVAVNSFFENITLITQTIDFIGEPASKLYSHF